MEEVRLDSEALGPVGKSFVEFASAKMKGQERAIHRLAKVLDHADSPLRVRNGPIYSVLVVGGAGSGKSYLPKLLAEFWFENPDGLTVIPCSQFLKTSFDRGMLIRHDFNFQLKGENKEILASYTNAVNEKNEIGKKLGELVNSVEPDDEAEKKKIHDQVVFLEKKFREKAEELEKIYNEAEPILANLRSIMVLDHIEESDLCIQEALENILETGMFQVHNNGESWKIPFTNSIVFITCNNCITLEEKSSNAHSKIGFSSQTEQSKRVTGEGENRYLRGMPEVKDYFSSKFRSRLDRIEILKEYQEDKLIEIVNLFFDEFKKWLKDNFPVTLIVEEGVKKFIVREGSDHPEFGIRLLKNKFDKHIRGKLELLEQKKLISKNDTIRVYMDKKEGKDIVAFAKLPSK